MKGINKGIFNPIKAIDEVSKKLYLMAEISMLGMMAIVFVSVILRYVFNTPWHWTEEVTELMLVLLTFFATAEILRIRRHIKLTLLFDRFPIRPRKGVDIFFCAVGLVFCAVLAREVIDVAWIAWEADMRRPTLLSSPLVLPYSFMAVGFIFLFLEYLVRIIKIRGKS